MYKEEEAKEIMYWRDKGFVLREIAEKTNIGYNQARYIIKKNNLSMIPNSIRNCVICGEQFKAERREALTCSEECSDKYFESNRKAKHSYICKQCGKTFKHVSRKKIKFCSNECREQFAEEEREEKEIAKEKAKERQCICKWCGNVFVTTNKRNKYCSNECRRLNTNKMQRDKADISIVDKVCKECGKHFSTKRSRKLFCSKECSIKYSQRIREVKRRHKIKENGEIHWNISVERLYKRDKGICYLCGEQCNFQDYYFNKNGTEICGNDYPSIDHIFPISKGGTHTWNNVKLAHRNCNGKKSNILIENLKAIEK